MKTLISFLLLCPFFGHTQSWSLLHATTEARARITTTTNEWFAMANPASLAFANSSYINLSAQNKFGLSALNRYGLGYQQKLRKSGMAVGVEQYGYSLYKETATNLAYGLLLAEKLSAGIELAYKSIFIVEQLQKQQSSQMGTAVIWKINERFEIGTRLIMNKRLANYFTQVKLGLKYQLDPKLHVLTEGFTIAPKKLGLALALEYQPTKEILIIYGLKNWPFTNSIGVGFAKQKFSLLLTAQTHQVLGWSPVLSVNHKIGK